MRIEQPVFPRRQAEQRPGLRGICQNRGNHVRRTCRGGCANQDLKFLRVVERRLPGVDCRAHRHGIAIGRNRVDRARSKRARGIRQVRAGNTVRWEREIERRSAGAEEIGRWWEGGKTQLCHLHVAVILSRPEPIHRFKNRVVASNREWGRGRRWQVKLQRLGCRVHVPSKAGQRGQRIEGRRNRVESVNRRAGNRRAGANRSGGDRHSSAHRREQIGDDIACGLGGVTPRRDEKIVEARLQ